MIQYQIGIKVDQVAVGQYNTMPGRLDLLDLFPNRFRSNMIKEGFFRFLFPLRFSCFSFGACSVFLFILFIRFIILLYYLFVLRGLLSREAIYIIYYRVFYSKSSRGSLVVFRTFF